MAEDRHDLIVIGAGPAGYAAAIRAAQLGLSVACIDDRPGAGGTCLNVGCIPSKALLASSERVARARTEWPDHGLVAGEIAIDLEALMARKASVVDRLTAGVDALLDKNGVERVHGRGRLLGRRRVGVVVPEGDDRELQAANVLLATGSRPTALPGLEVDQQRILDSTGALSLSEVPEHLAVVGGGYVGLELGSVWRRLGAEVTVIELQDRLLPGMDPELAEALGQRLEEQGLRFRLRRAVGAAHRDGESLVLRLRDGSSGTQEAGAEEPEGAEELVCSHVLTAVGREPATGGLGLETAGVELGADGFVRTDSRFRTTAPGIHAVGDLVGDPMLAHKGLLEGIACVEAIAGRGSGWVSYDAIPSVVYTWPEVASVGRDEAALREAGVRYRSGRASFRHDPRALCTGEAVGFVKLLVEDGSDRLLGAQLIGPHAGSLAHELVMAAELRGSVEELGRAPHAHPTLNETLREAALDAHGRAIHQ